jgi:hypothetical protein
METPPEPINHLVQQFLKATKNVLADANRINTFTYEEFRPLLPFFTKEFDRERCQDDVRYRDHWQRRWDEQMRLTPINPFQPILVTVSKTDPTEVFFFDRGFTRIASDYVPEGTERQYPAKPAYETKDEKADRMLSTSVSELAAANNTKERISAIARAKMLSAIVTARFVKYNMTEADRKALLGDNTLPQDPATPQTPADDQYVPSASLFSDEDD